jgi:hypothetical protein
VGGHSGERKGRVNNKPVSTKKEFNASLLAVAIIFLAGFPAWSQDQASLRKRDSLKNFLRDYLKDPATRYRSAFVDLKDDGTQDAIVYLTGQSWCGSGGCTLLTLAPDGPSYRVVTKITVVLPPIRVLATRSNGWHDIGVQVRGGGIQSSYEADLPFDGETYPSNPSVPPARKLGNKGIGKVVINSDLNKTQAY